MGETPSDFVLNYFTKKERKEKKMRVRQRKRRLNFKLRKCKKHFYLVSFVLAS